VIAAPESKASVSSARLWRQFDKYVVSTVKPYADRAERLLIIEGGRAVHAWLDAGEAAAVNSVQERPWEIYLTRLYLGVAPQAGDMVTEWLVTLKAKRPRDVFDQATSAWLRTNGGERIQGITDTSREEIARQIRIGVDKNESRQQIADRISSHRRSIAPGRAHVIARTEVHTAANFGSWVAANQVSETLEKIWMATPDGRARDAHLAANGQRRPLNKPFLVGGENLLFPGAPGASADATVNCRCSLNFVVARKPARRPRAA
jgi:hypothetical protein